MGVGGHDGHVHPARRVLAAIGVGALVTGVLLVWESRHSPERAPVEVTRTTAGPSTSSSTSTSTSTSRSTGDPVASAPFTSSVEPVTTAQLGASWHEGCPLGADGLRLVVASYWGYDDAAHHGEIVVTRAEVDHVVAVLQALYDARFPIQAMVPIASYAGDDQASMRANNTSGFNCRVVSGTSRWSEHAFGRAIDVNPLMNPYVQGSSIDPPEGAPYADRRRTDQGLIHGGDAAVRAFAAQGWRWGGYWSSGKDYQHFSATGR